MGVTGVTEVEALIRLSFQTSHVKFLFQPIAGDFNRAHSGRACRGLHN